VAPVRSEGTPIFATTQLNALKGFIALALIHYGTDHPRWGDLLERIGNRNLVQMRLDPDFSKTVGLKVFEDVLGGDKRLLFGEAVWLPQQPDHSQTSKFSTCPDCGGRGNLREAVGTFDDTRTILPYDDGQSSSPSDQA
jgi:hypothetical protein